jgi:tripartite-type tricarboxylate transporter receptor subunit TctC
MLCEGQIPTWEAVMKHSRRHFLQLATGAAALSIISSIAFAQSYPTRPVRWIVGYPPGGATDITARLIGQWLSERLAQPFVVENRPGASGNIGTEAVVRAAPDGYTLLLVNAGNTINETLYDGLNFVFLRDITAVASIVRVPLVLLVNPSLPIKTVPELIAHAKNNPGKLNMASPGSGTPHHVSGELFKMMTNTTMTHVPYRGSAPALSDLIGGQVQVAFDTTTASIEYVRAGRLRALAVTTASRSDVLPDIPTVGDFVPGYEATGWYGAGAPKGTSAAIVGKLNMEINAALADRNVRTRLGELGATVVASSPSDFAKFMSDETEKWAKVIKFSGAKAH